MELCRKHGASQATYYKWQSKFGNTAVPHAERLNALEEENRRVKLLLAETMLQCVQMAGGDRKS